MASAKVIPLRRITAPARNPSVVQDSGGDDVLLQARIDAAVGGDPYAAQALLVAVLSRVRRLIRYLVRSEDIDDLTQDALLTVLEQLHRYRGEGRFEAWVDTITLRMTLRNVSKRRIDRNRFHAELLAEPHAPATTHDAAGYVTFKRAVQALDQLPQWQRVPLVMHHVLGMTVSEIAAELDAPFETVRSRLRIGMRELRTLLGMLPEEEP